MTSTSADLVLGPLLRYVDETSAVRLGRDRASRARVTVTARTASPGRRGTFAVHGHHYALVELRRPRAGHA